jgi:hypothetical protein
MKIGLAIPHAPWVPGRGESFARLMRELKSVDAPCLLIDHAVFGEKEPNWSWSRKLWSWGMFGKHDYLVQLQDDVLVAPAFWAALSAMLTALPDQVIGLESAHPAMRTLSRDGHRWCTSRAWMVGVGYVIPRAALAELMKFRESFDAEARRTNEDEFIARWCVATGRSVWHPMPTIIDHDTDVASTYGNDAHTHRRPVVTWRDYSSRELSEPAFWKPSEDVPMVTNPHLESCWGCAEEPAEGTFAKTGLKLGRNCVANAASHMIRKGAP